MKQMSFTVVTLTLAFLIAAPALAQTGPAGAPPSAAELKLPGSAQPAEVVVTTTTTTTPAPSSSETATGMPDDPCPNLKGATANAPDDLSKVQQDIDRFTLCVQRAQLLERLNESAIKSTAAADAAMGLGIGGMPMGGVPSMPPLPANALGGADVTPAAPAAMAPGSDINAGNPVAADTTGSVATAPAVEAPEAQWQIREIFGSTADMQARLLSPHGDEMKVKKGTKLPDSSVVMSVTPEGVSIRGKKGVTSLEWAKS